jgi:hypothetical protein
VTPTGSEHICKSQGKTGVGQEGGAKSGAFSTESALLDPDLAKVVAAWPGLSDGVRRRILGLLDTREGRVE